MMVPVSDLLMMIAEKSDTRIKFTLVFMVWRVACSFLVSVSCFINYL